MITLRSFKQIPTSRTIPSFRACLRSRQGASSPLQDQGRIAAGQAQRQANEARRQWLSLLGQSQGRADARF